MDKKEVKIQDIMMNEGINANIKYVSEYRNSNNQPLVFNGPCFVDKQYCGCGFTHMVLQQSFEYPTVLIACRVALLACKKHAFKDALHVKQGVTKNNIATYIRMRLSKNEHPKIMVTDASLHKVIGAINDVANLGETSLSSFKFIWDEAQLLFENYRSQSINNALNLVFDNHLDCTFVSAILPSMELINAHSLLKDIPYYQLKWREGLQEKVNIVKIETKNPLGAALNMINDFKAGIYPTVTIDNVEYQSKHLNIFLNSVTAIVNLIKTAKLQPNEVNLIISKSDNDRNDNILRKLTREMFPNHEGDPLYKVGEFYPREIAEEKPMIQLMTSTSFQGCEDFSKDTTTLIVCDGKSANTLLDVSLEIQQIVSRLRLQSPFRNTVYMAYSTTRYGMNDEQFDNHVEGQKALSRTQISTYEYLKDQLNKATNDLDADAWLTKINNMHKSFNNGIEPFGYLYYDKNTDEYKDDEIMRLADYHKQCVVNNLFKNGTYIYNAINDSTLIECNQTQLRAYEEVVKLTIKNTTFEDKFATYVTWSNSNDEALVKAANQLDEKYKYIFSMFIDKLGEDKCASYGYQRSKLQKLVDGTFNEERKMKKYNDPLVKLNMQKITKELATRLYGKDTISAKDLKAMIKELYAQYHIPFTAKATSIVDHGFWVDVKDVKVDGKAVHSYIIKSRPKMR